MDLYNYWLMEKAAEEEKQESFAKRHKGKLIGGGVGGGVSVAGGIAAAHGLERHGGRAVDRNLQKALHSATGQGEQELTKLKRGKGIKGKAQRAFYGAKALGKKILRRGK